MSAHIQCRREGVGKLRTSAREEGVREFRFKAGGEIVSFQSATLANTYQLQLSLCPSPLYSFSGRVGGGVIELRLDLCFLHVPMQRLSDWH